MMGDPQPTHTVSDPEFNANADQNLAEMAQRLEAELRRTARTSEVRPAEPPPRAMTADTETAPPANPRAAAPPPPPAESSAARAEAKSPKSVYDSLEKEMANLLGRPSGKS
jgi:hypothetical protein